MEQAVRDGLIKINPARVTGRQKEYKQAEDEVDDPRSLALPDRDTLTRLATALVARSHDQYAGGRGHHVRRLHSSTYRRSLRRPRR